MPSGGGVYKGKIYGFPIGGKCFINRDCKVTPIRRYLAKLAGGSRRVRKNIVQYIGIAKDEPSRLGRIDGSRKISLLDKYGYTEAMARSKCEEYGLLSPIYQTGTRNGCWFCPNCSLKQFSQFRKQHPDLWGGIARVESHAKPLLLWLQVWQDLSRGRGSNGLGRKTTKTILR